MADRPDEPRRTIRVCPECGRDNFASGGRGEVYHWRDCSYDGPLPEVEVGPVGRKLSTERVAAIYKVPPHLVDGRRVRFWRLRAILIRWWVK